MKETGSYINISERYGEQVPVTLEDYRELNPEGTFVEHHIGVPLLIERFSETPGDFEIVARPDYQVEEPEPLSPPVPDADKFPDEWPDEFLSDEESARKNAT